MKQKEEKRNREREMMTREERKGNGRAREEGGNGFQETSKAKRQWTMFFIRNKFCMNADENPVRFKRTFMEIFYITRSVAVRRV